MAELGLLAFHWYAAHDLPAAYTASMRAGLAARKYGGPEAMPTSTARSGCSTRSRTTTRTSPPRPT